MTDKKKAAPESSAKESDSNSTAVTSKQKRLLFPVGLHASHSQLILAMLLKRKHCCQYSYHRISGFPTSDFRTRVSELTQGGWPIERDFHTADDVNGEPARCKHYWLDMEAVSRLFADDPVLSARCKVLVAKYSQEVECNG